MFKTQYTQPFTLHEATLLDPFTITEEIARLQNSLDRLRQTQEELVEYTRDTSTPDPDYVQAIEDNQITIASQEERIVILRKALVQKGVITETSNHYDLLGPRPSNSAQATPQPQVPHPQTEEEGIIL